MTSGPIDIVRITTAGSVDDGKSTLIGRLLLDTGNLYADHRAALEADATRRGSSSLGLALLTDGLKAEREQGITIDVAYRYFSTERRRFILTDAPGHIEYTRNMATAASNAHVAILLVDARAGITEQTHRHAFIAALFGVPRFVIAVNKMDLVDYSAERFETIEREFGQFAEKLGVREIRFIPIAALAGDNVVNKSPLMPWYHGQTILEYLDSVYVGADENLVDLRFPVQSVLNTTDGGRLYAGTVASGELRCGDEIVALPKGVRSTIREILAPDSTLTPRPLESAVAGSAVALRLDTEVDISRGTMLTRPRNQPRVTDAFDATLVWMGDTPFDPVRRYLVRHTTAAVKLITATSIYTLDVGTLHRGPPGPLETNDIVRVEIRVANPLCLDPYSRNRGTGSFILVDTVTGSTVAAGVVIERGENSKLTLPNEPKATENLHSTTSLVSSAERERRAGHPAVTIWFTGLSGSGKSTIAIALERQLFDVGHSVTHLDGDNLRRGLCTGLGFSPTDRTENIRRTAEAAAILNRAGVSALCALISPLEADRDAARAIIGPDRFIEVYISTPLEVCESRDPHGLYAKARAKTITNFTGVSSPYEPPKAPALTLDLSSLSVDAAVQELVTLLRTR